MLLIRSVTPLCYLPLCYLPLCYLPLCYLPLCCLLCLAWGCSSSSRLPSPNGHPDSGQTSNADGGGTATFCATNTDCQALPETPVCDLLGGKCIQCLQDAQCPTDEVCKHDHLCHGTKACTKDDDCNVTSICGPEATCVLTPGRCLGDRDCLSPLKKRCDSTSLVCVGCITTRDCVNQTGRRQCEPSSMQCVQCLTTTDCATGTCAGNQCQSTDAGSTDAGSTDAGSTAIDLHGIGTRCTDSSMMAQSDCSHGLNCIQLSTGANMCTKQNCAADADCGKTGTSQNLCTGNTNAYCLRGCDPTQPVSCARTDFACITDATTGSSFCIPDCRVTNYCTYPETCSATIGDCSGSATCDTATPCATTGDVCTPDTNSNATPPPSVCVADCTKGGTSACPSGFTCDMTKKTCSAIQRNYYETCAKTDGQCVSNDLCIGFGMKPGQQICLQQCTTNADCPTSPNSACVVALTGGTSVCGITCTMGATPTTCPTGTDCLYQGRDPVTMAATYFCGPRP
jgi:hypothetical protein